VQCCFSTTKRSEDSSSLPNAYWRIHLTGSPLSHFEATILRAVMFAAFMARLFCSRARPGNRRIASYVTVFAKLPLLLTPLPPSMEVTPLSDKRARQKSANVAARSIHIPNNQMASNTSAQSGNGTATARPPTVPPSPLPNPGLSLEVMPVPVSRWV
jgi:hypothetical protein